MTVERGSVAQVEGTPISRNVLVGLLVAVVAVAIIVAAGLAFGWTVPQGQDFGITADPAGELPF